MRLLVALVVHVSIRRSDVHTGLALVVVRRLVGLLGVRRLRRLHERRRRLWSCILVLVRGGRSAVLRDLRVGGTLRRWHLLVARAWLVGGCHLFGARTAGRSKRGVAGVGHRAGPVVCVKRRIRRRHTGLLSIDVWSGSAPGAIVTTLFVEFVPVFVGLVLATPHTNIASNADAATLLGDHATQSSALRQSRELLRGEDYEGGRLDLQTVGDVSVDAALVVGIRRTILRVHVLLVLQLLVQSEAQAVLSLVTDGQIREDEVTSRAWAVQIGHTSDGGAGEDGEAGRGGRSAAAGGNGSGILQGGEQEEVGVVAEGDVLLTLEDLELDNRRRVDRTAVGA